MAQQEQQQQAGPLTLCNLTGTLTLVQHSSGPPAQDVEKLTAAVVDTQAEIDCMNYLVRLNQLMETNKTRLRRLRELNRSLD